MISHKSHAAVAAMTIIVVFASLATLYASELESTAPAIPANFLGNWVETGNDGKVVGEFNITTGQIEWIRGGKSQLLKKYSVEDNGKTIGLPLVS